MRKVSLRKHAVIVFNTIFRFYLFHKYVFVLFYLVGYVNLGALEDWRIRFHEL